MKKLSPYLIPSVIFCLALGLRLAYWLVIGIQRGSDTPRYVDAAQAIIQNHGNPLTLLTIGQPLYFWLYPIIIALMGGSPAAVVGLHILLHAFAAVLIYKTAERLFNRTAGLIAGLVYAAFWELFQWDVYILTDSVFLFLVVVLIYTYVSLITTRQKKYWWWMIGLLIACLLQRPHGLVVAAVFGLALFTQLKGRIRLLMVALSCFVVAGYLLVLNSGSVQQNIGLYQGVVTTFYADGVVIDGRPAYNLPVDGVGSLLILMLHRLWAFWFIYPVEFAPVHKLLNALYLIPLYSFSLFGTFRLWQQRPERRPFIYIVLLFTVLYWVATALTNVDYDWRLRLPIWPFIILMASYGLSLLLRRVPFSVLWQGLRFSLVGGTAFVIDVGGYYVLTRFFALPYLLARVLTIALALIWNFSLNRSWTFNATMGNQSRQLIRYLTIMGSTSLLNILFLKLGVEKLHLPDMVVVVVVTGLMAGVNFFGHRYWTYRTKEIHAV